MSESGKAQRWINATDAPRLAGKAARTNKSVADLFTEVEKVPCVTCGAEETEWCVEMTRTGEHYSRAVPHQARIDASGVA